MLLQPGAMVRDNVRLVRMLGEGAMGSVWVAEHLALRTQVAVKFIHSELAQGDPEVLARFTREASLAAQIKSPHVVQTFDLGVMDNGAPYIVMELLHGQSLGDRLARSGPLSPRQTAEVVAQVARVLEKAHQLGIVHRDIKPDNIFLVDTGDGTMFAKVLDFGIAKQATLSQPGGLTQPGKMVGTPAYMSREQIISSRDVDHHADVWALAVVAYEALTGVLPFDAETVGLICVRICEGSFVPATQRRPDLPPEIDAFFQRALHQDQSWRYPSVRELSYALLTLAANSHEDLDNIQEALLNTGRFLLPQIAYDLPPPPRESSPRAAPATFSGAATSPQPTAPLGRWPKLAIGSLVLAGAAVLILLVVLLAGQTDEVSPPPAAAASSAPAPPASSTAGIPSASVSAFGSSATTMASSAAPAASSTPPAASTKPRRLSPEEQLGF